MRRDVDTNGLESGVACQVSLAADGVQHQPTSMQTVCQPRNMISRAGTVTKQHFCLPQLPGRTPGCSTAEALSWQAGCGSSFRLGQKTQHHIMSLNEADLCGGRRRSPASRMRSSRKYSGICATQQDSA